MMLDSQFHVAIFIECPEFVKVVLEESMALGALEASHSIHLGCF